MGPNNPQDFQQPGQTFGPASQPPSYQTPVPPSTPQQPHAHNPNKNDNKTKKLVILIVGLLVVFAVIAIVALIAGGGDKRQSEQPTETTETQPLVKEPSAIDLENVNNSISDDVTNLSTDSDFPADNLSDEKLEL